MNRRIITIGLGLLILAALAFTAYRGLASPPQSPPPIPQAELALYAPPEQWNLPAEGWSVCRVGSSEPIEGVGERQVFDLCHAQGWQLKTYCLDPGMPIPRLGAMCSQLVGGTYWCGDGVQQLGFVAVLQAAETATVPSQTPPATATYTAPSAPQQQQTGYPPPPEETAYPVPQDTATTAPTAMPTRTFTPQITRPPQQATATLTGTAVIATPVIVTPATAAPTARSTPYNRPAAGGPGNLDVLINGLGALGLAGGTLGLGLQGRKALLKMFRGKRSRK